MYGEEVGDPSLMRRLSVYKRLTASQINSSGNRNQNNNNSNNDSNSNRDDDTQVFSR